MVEGSRSWRCRRMREEAYDAQARDSQRLASPAGFVVRPQPSPAEWRAQVHDSPAWLQVAAQQGPQQSQGRQEVGCCRASSTSSSRRRGGFKCVAMLRRSNDASTLAKSLQPAVDLREGARRRSAQSMGRVVSGWSSVGAQEEGERRSRRNRCVRVCACVCVCVCVCELCVS